MFFDHKKKTTQPASNLKFTSFVDESLFDLFNSPERGIRLSVENVVKNYLEKVSVLLTLHNQRYRFSNRNGICTNQKLILTRSFRENTIAASLRVRDREVQCVIA